MIRTAEGQTPGPWRTTAAIAWFAAAPWIVGLVRGVILRQDVGDAASSVTWCVAAFLVTFPCWRALLHDARPSRPILATIVHALAVGAPFVSLGVAVLIWGSMTWGIALGLLVSWSIMAAFGAGLSWAIARFVPRLWALDGRGIVWRVWRREARQWWEASLTATSVAAVAAPVLLLIDPGVGAALVVMVAAGPLLEWVLATRSIDNTVLLWEFVLSLPVMAAATFAEDPSTPLVVALGVAGAAVFPALTARGARDGTPVVAAA